MLRRKEFEFKLCIRAVSVRGRGVQHGVSKGVEDGCRLPTLWVATPETAKKPFQGGHLQGVKVKGMAGHSNTIGSPWPPLAIRP
jgi:hypothetical protein